MKYNFAFQGYQAQNMAKAVGLDLPISVKHAAMVCNAIRGKGVERSKKILQDVIEKKQPIKYTRFNFDRGHQAKAGPARYPVKTCEEILKVVKSAEANANQKSLSDLIVKHICVHKASKPWHYGRQSRRQMKRAHVEIVLGQKQVKQEAKKESNKETKKAK